MVRESIVFGSNFRNGDFDGLHVMKSSESQNHIFGAWSVCMCIFVSVFSITHKQIIAEKKIFYSIFESYIDAT